MSRVDIRTEDPHILALFLSHVGASEEKIEWLCEARKFEYFDWKMAAAILEPEVSRESLHCMFSFETPLPHRAQCPNPQYSSERGLKSLGCWPGDPVCFPEGEAICSSEMDYSPRGWVPRDSVNYHSSLGCWPGDPVCFPEKEAICSSEMHYSPRGRAPRDSGHYHPSFGCWPDDPVCSVRECICLTKQM